MSRSSNDEQNSPLMFRLQGNNTKNEKFDVNWNRKKIYKKLYPKHGVYCCIVTILYRHLVILTQHEYVEIEYIANLISLNVNSINR